MNEFVVLQELGHGAYGNVTLIEDAKTKTKYVLKDVDLSRCNAKERTSAEMEVKILSTLRHPNIVQYKWSYQTTQGALHIIMSYCDGGDLHSLIKSRNGILVDENQVLDWFVQITMAVEYIHDRHILHRDLKTPNIFVTKNNVIKVGDFGISRILDKSGDYATTLIGTPFYMSPEIFMNKPYNFKSDIWAIGCCLFELCALRHPFKAKDIQALAHQVLIAKTPLISENYSTEIQKILKACLHKVAEKRPSARKILRHPFVRKHIVSYLKSSMHRINIDSQHSTNTKVAKCPELMNSLLPQVAGTRVRSSSMSRHRKKPRLQIVKDRSMERSREENDSESVDTAKATANVEIKINETTTSKQFNETFLLSKVRSSSAPGLHRLKDSTGRILVSAGPMRVNSANAGTNENENNNDEVDLLMNAMRQTLKMADIEKEDC